MVEGGIVMTDALLEKMTEIEKKAGKDWVMEFQNADSPRAIILLAGKYGITVPEEVAEEALGLLSETELSDEELMTISGGFASMKGGHGIQG